MNTQENWYFIAKPKLFYKKGSPIEDHLGTFGKVNSVKAPNPRVLEITLYNPTTGNPIAYLNDSDLAEELIQRDPRISPNNDFIDPEESHTPKPSFLEK